MGGQGFQISFKALDIPLVVFDFFGEILEQLVLQPVLLCSGGQPSSASDGKPHIQVHAFLDTRVSGAQGLDLGKGKRRFVHIIGQERTGFCWS